ncbi:MAG: gliding motility-associated C-terminal domain-containing protein, partial [Saprospiraceae bacterium]|nr:gliding motility-associated C-terminal domain-containing protein [Saprospiraceae bacterium]
DSTVNLVLEMVEAIHTNLDYFICTGDSVVVNDIAYYEAGTYSDTMVSAGGCDSVIFINISQATQKFVILEDTICEGSGFNFGGNVYTESTSFVDTIPSLSGCDSIVQVNLVVLPKYESEVFVSICTGTSYTHDGVVYDMEGVYELSYQSNQGCDSIIHLHIDVVDQINTELVVQNCTGGTFDFNGTTITEAGTYIDTFTSINGCDSIVSLQFELHDIIQTFQNYTICSGDSILINGQVYSEATIFSDTSISIMGCDSVAHHEVVLVSDIALTGGSAVICPGEEVQLSVTVEGDLLGLINWTPKEDLSCSDCLDPIASPPNTTTYEITTMGCLGSEIRAEYQVEVVPLPELSIIQNPGPNGGQEVVLSATTIDPQHNINWYDESGELICANCTSIVQTVLGDQTFVASAANSLGCEVTEEISVSINTENQCDVGSIIASNAMTPNGDGSNDQFQIINSSDAEITLVQVLNRWGETVFESHGIEDLWDGTVRGNPVNPGVYVYMIFGICTEGDFQLVGNVTVIR